MNCKKCGTRIHKGDPSCPICAAVLQASAQNVPDNAETPPISVPDEAPVSILEAALNAGKTTVAPADAPSESPAVPAKKRSKKPLLLIGILILAVVGAVIALLPSGDQPDDKQTVYLITESVTENIGGTSEIHHYAYDDAGRIISYRYTYQYPSHYEIKDSGYEISYRYDSAGRIAKAVFAYDETVIEADYVYEDGRLVDIQCKDLAGRLGYDEIRITCDSQGRLQAVDAANTSWEFTYHSNGTIQQISKHLEYDYSTFPGGYDFFQIYDEAGNLIEYATKFLGMDYRQLYSYNSRGRMTGTEIYSNGEATAKVAFDYTYKGDRLTGMVIRMETASEGKQMEAAITFGSNWVGNVCTLTMDDLEGDTELLESFALGSGHLKIVFELDDAGNLLNSKVYSDGEVTMSNRYAYQAFQLPDSYVKHNYQATPLYLYFLLGSD